MNNDPKKDAVLEEIGEALNAYESNSVDLINRAFQEGRTAGGKSCGG